VVIEGLERMVKDAGYDQESIEDRQRRFKLSLRRRACSASSPSSVRSPSRSSATGTRTR
jgi:hypothetical protein